MTYLIHQYRVFYDILLILIVFMINFNITIMIYNLHKIINEEINNFDFLNINSNKKAMDNRELLSNPILQKQIICDALSNDKIKINTIEYSKLIGDFQNPNFNEITNFSIDYDIELLYKYDTSKPDLIFKLQFSGKDIPIEVTGISDKGSEWIGPYYDPNIKKIDWTLIDVELLDEDENIIDFTAFNSAPYNIRKLFIRRFIQSFVTSNSGIDVIEPINNTNISKF